ncbi:MAG TPA: hypothetical protein VGM90_03620 [Kofleriaceae bacterium]|jgi:hypothetical protein
MRNTILLASLLSILGSGCYFGRSPSHKTAAYLANGTMAFVGTALIASGSGNECNGDCLAVTIDNDAIGAVLVGAAVVGVLVTLAVPTKHEETRPAIAPANVTTHQTVTAPGLKPAAVTLR